MTKRIIITGTLLTVIALGMFYNPDKPIKVISSNESTNANEYVISEEMVLSKLRTESQIVSLTQHIEKKDTYVDDSFFGERQTTLAIKGTVKLGLNTSDIKVKCIDVGVVTLHIGKPVVISLELPYDNISFDKTKGLFRREMNAEERKKFYEIVEKNVRKSLLDDKDLMKQADVFNKNAVEEILKSLPSVKGVIFE